MLGMTIATHDRPRSPTIGAVDRASPVSRTGKAPLVFDHARAAASRPRVARLQARPESTRIAITAKEIQMSDDDLKAELERLREENAALKKGATRGVSLKVSEKGGLSVYGLGRFPVTLYKEQWVKLLDMSDEIRTFLKTHDAQLKTKE